MSGIWFSGTAPIQQTCQPGGDGDSVSFIIAGGHIDFVPPYGTFTNITQLFNGTTFSSSGTLTAATNQAAACGNASTALFTGGYSTGPYQIAIAEQFNGSIWSNNGKNLVTAREDHAMNGSISDAICSGGWNGSTSPNVLNLCEKYNGTVWSNIGTLSQARLFHSGGGSSSSAISFGGYLDGNFWNSDLSSTEKFNGSTWSASGTMNYAGGQRAGGGGSSSASLASGGWWGGNVKGLLYNTSENFNGSVWSIDALLLGARQTHASGVSSNGAIASAGLSEDAFLLTTELYTLSSTLTGWTDLLKNAIMDLLWGNQSYTPADTVYLGFCTGVASNGVITGEPSDNNYARIPITNNMTNFPASSSGSKAIPGTGSFVFPEASDSWGPLTMFFISDHLTGNSNTLLYGPLAALKYVNKGDMPYFPQDSITLVIN